MQALEGYSSIELPPQPTPDLQFATWQGMALPKAHWVAFSEASVAATMLAAKHQALSLSLFSPILRCDAALTARVQPLQQALALGRSHFGQAVLPWMFGAFMLERGQVAIEAWKEGLTSLDLASFLQSLLELGDRRREMRQLNCPVQVVFGSEDAFTPARYAQEAVDWTPLHFGDWSAMRLGIEGGGHLAAWEHPQECGALLQGFLDQSASVRAGALSFGGK